MSELAKEILPIAVMYGFVLLLAPFIGVTMWIAFDGDRLRDSRADDAPESVDATEAITGSANQAQPQAREALGAA